MKKRFSHRQTEKRFDIGTIRQDVVMGAFALDGIECRL